MQPVVLILAGGRASRMGGGDKSLRKLGGATIFDHVLARLRAQHAGTILLNAKDERQNHVRFDLPIVRDSVPDQPGPLAGVLAGMEWVVSNHVPAVDLITVPTDTPFIPLDLIDRLTAGRAAADAEIACAASAGRLHNVTALWPVRLAPLLRHALLAERIRRVDRWTSRFKVIAVPFASGSVDPFMNINTPEDLEAAEAALAAGAGHFLRGAGG